VKASPSLFWWIMQRYKRMEMLIGKDNIESINSKRIIVFGLGGVGGSLCEALVRAGIKNITIVDDDIIDITNLNRQLIATLSTIGQRKVDAMEARLLDIDDTVKINKICKRLEKDNISDFDLSSYDYIADAIDSVESKVYLAKYCYENSLKIISSMGVGNRFDPSKLRVDDIFKTSMDPLARVMRNKLKKLGVKKLDVVYSLEKAASPLTKLEKQSTPGSMPYVPPVSGLIMASHIINSFIEVD
jgi:tRNA A37 threonylcarbamoyladenosine dehydratase